MKRVLAGLECFLPIVFTAVATVLLIHYGFNPKLNRFDKIVDGSITFASIIAGFLAAMLGILVSIKESKIVKAIFQSRTKRLLAFYFSESIFLGFLVVGFAGALYLVMDVDGLKTTVVFVTWTVLLFWFLASSLRIIFVMLLVLFYDEEKNVRPASNRMSDEERVQSRIANARKVD